MVENVLIVVPYRELIRKMPSILKDIRQLRAMNVLVLVWETFLQLAGVVIQTLRVVRQFRESVVSLSTGG